MTIRHVLAAASVLALTALSCQTASAYDRGVTRDNSNGTYTKPVEGACADGVCSRDAQITGPNGGTVSRSGQCAHGRRFYGSSGTVTGPNGNTVTRRVVGRRRFY